MARRPSEQTRAAIQEAARELFRERGYAATSVRDIAAAAGSDPALVIRHFGSKEKLFLASLETPLTYQPLLDGPVETLGERYVRYLLTDGEQVRNVFLALIRASDGEAVGSRLREVHDAGLVFPLLSRVSGPDAELRARLAGALIGGLVYSLWLVGDDVLAHADPEAIVSHYGPALQRILTPPE